MIEVSEGQKLPVLERTLDVIDLMAYGAATWDWHPLHFDHEYTLKLGMNRPVVDGQMFGALLAKQLVDWLGPQTFISQMSLRYKAMVFAGETVTCDGAVTAVAEETIEVSQTVRVGDGVAVEATARVTGGATPLTRGAIRGGAIPQTSDGPAGDRSGAARYRANIPDHGSTRK